MVEFIQTVEQCESFRHLSPTDAADVYKELRRKVIGEGLLDRSYGFYAGLTTLIFTGFFGSFAGVYFSQSFLSWSYCPYCLRSFRFRLAD